MLLVLFAVFAVLIGFQFYYARYGPKQTPPAAQQPAQPAAQAPAQAGVSTPPPPVAPTGRRSRQRIAPPPANVKQAAAETETVIENDLYRITFTNRGGQVKSWVLTQYKDDKGNPLDLVNHIAAQQYGFPLSLFTYDQNLRNKLNSALYVVNVMGTQKAPTELVFEYSDGTTSVRKSFHFDHSYVVKTDIQVTENGAPVQAYPAWPGGFGDQTVAASYAVGRIDWEYSGKIQREAIRKVSGGGTMAGPFYWAATTDQYFAAVFMPDDPVSSAMVTFRNTIQIPKNLDKPNPNEMQPVEVLGAAVGNMAGHTSERIFIGPKNLGLLDSIHATAVAGQGNPPDLQGLVDFGMFSFIARPLFMWLRWTQQHMVPNWGWAIIILTVIINVALLPLRFSSMKSALKMQKIQPQLQAVKEKYSKYPMRDPRRAEQQKETAAIMKEHGVNPVGGCLPLLIQFPFLIAFYTMLGNTIELRHAGWFYLSDLSSPDPWHILPIAIVVTTWLVQKMTPSAGMDPAQQKMMNLTMPVMLGFFAWNVASGLGLYWITSTLVGIVMQWFINQTHLGREMKTIAEKRARKRQLKQA